MRKWIALASLSLLIGGCSAVSTATSTVDMTNPSKAAYVAKASYDAALVLATQYARLPRCGEPTSPPLCSDRAVLTTMLKLSAAADVATQGAEDAVRSLGAKPALVRVAIEGAQKSVSVFKEVAETYAGGK